MLCKPLISGNEAVILRFYVGDAGAKPLILFRDLLVLVLDCLYLAA